MPKGYPKIGSSVGPKPEVLGSIPNDHPVMDPQPQSASGVFETAEGTRVTFDEGPPPWELEANGGLENSDARRYVEAPPSVTLRWINPRLLESQGWRYWKPVLASDPRFKVLVQEMVAPDGNVRRGGGVGDILAWMPTEWVLARRRQLAEETSKRTQSAVNRQDELREEFRRTGGLVTMEESRHPTHTLADGRSLKD